MPHVRPRPRAEGRREGAERSRSRADFGGPRAPGPALRALLAAALLFLGAGALAESPLRIGTITIRSLDVFSPEEAARGWLYRAADAVHVETRSRVIRKFLLFAEGDLFDPEVLAQTERNLRALEFIKRAEVTAGPPHDGVVDVDVLTQDTWTTVPSLSLGRKGGVSTYGLALKERNVLGTGTRLSFTYSHGVDRTTRLLQLSDPYLLGPYWNGDLILASSSDGHEERLNVERPFFSFTSSRSGRLLADDLRQTERLYAGGDVSSEFRQDHRQLLAEYGFAALATDERARRVSAGFEWIDDRFANPPGRFADVLPDPRTFRTFFVGYEDVASDFLKLDYVNRDMRYEDFALGARLTARLGISPAILGAKSTTGLVHIEGSHGWRLGEAGFVLGQLSFDTRLAGGLRNALLSAEVRAARRFPTRLVQTLVARLQYSQGWRLDRDVQLFADGLTGLRGYRAYAFAGDRSLILNLEHRVFSGREILQLVAPGAAVFVDAGLAEPPGRPFRVADVKADAGVGVRFGLARAAQNNVIRVDLAYTLVRDPQGRRGFQVSFGSAQAF